MISPSTRRKRFAYILLLVIVFSASCFYLISSEVGEVNTDQINLIGQLNDMIIAGNVEGIRSLLDSGANPMLLDEKGRQPLEVARAMSIVCAYSESNDSVTDEEIFDHIIEVTGIDPQEFVPTENQTFDNMRAIQSILLEEIPDER